jgi:predicted metal-dependent phosphoesterase TrpH
LPISLAAPAATAAHSRAGLAPELIADFHLHSDQSDGELSPTALVDVVADAGVSIMALTDHDTTAGHDRARSRCAERGIAFVGGIEMTTYAMDRVIHVLGLGVRTRDEGLTRAGAAAQANFAENQKAWVEALAMQGAPVQWQRDFPDGAVRLPALIERLCLRGFEDGDPKRVHARFREFFRALLPGAYAPLPTPSGAADLIRAAGGIAILAHPYRIADDESWHAQLGGMDGLEALYGAYAPAQRSALCEIASAKHLLYSCGSDYHGHFFGPYQNHGFEAPPALLERLGIS